LPRHPVAMIRYVFRLVCPDLQFSKVTRVCILAAPRVIPANRSDRIEATLWMVLQAYLNRGCFFADGLETEPR